MANTIQSATNSFSKGIIMDFSPEVSGNESLVNALNATLLTYNGNEMALLNDMGNGRVETARLPEGYVPVGACEFGDIIYVVSYNPLLNKSLIGCFPSPERIIDSDETEQPKSSIKASDFQEFEEISVEGTTKLVPTGELKTSSKAYIVFGEPLNPGDKYIIAAKNLENNVDNITGISGIDPKYVKISVVSIEDNGKITYLETTQNKYPIKDNNNAKVGDYFLKQDTSSNNEPSPSDVDELRTKISSGYLIFKSKVSGKLALLVELEKISGFNCTYYLEKNDDYTENSTSIYEYKLKIETSWESESGVNPKGWMLTASDTSMKEEVKINGDTQKVSKFHLYDNSISDTDYSFTYPVVNNGKSNYYHEYSSRNNESLNNDPENDEHKVYEVDEKSSKTYLEDNENNVFYFKIPDSYKNGNDIYYYDISKCVYNFQVTPFMPYGLLREYSTNLSIDFSKIYTGAAQISKWKYYISDDYITLTLGLEIYPELNYSVPEIGIEFYNPDGFAAAYHITGKESYNGTFTEYIPLDGVAKSYKLNDIKVGATKKEEGDKSTGTLLSNIVYLAKIIVKYGTYDAQEKFIPAADKVFYRWLWTVPVFNDYYFSVEDYEPLQLNLELDNTMTFSPGDNYKEGYVDYLPDTLDLSENETWKKFNCSIVNYLNGDIKVDVYPNISNNYGVFSLDANGIFPNGSASRLQTSVFMGKLIIEQESAAVKSLNDTNESYPDLSTPQEGTFSITRTLKNQLGTSADGNNTLNLWENASSYLQNFTGQWITNEDPNPVDFEYISIEGDSDEPITVEGAKLYTLNVDRTDYCSHYIYKPDIVNFNKYLIKIEKEMGECTALRPFIYNYDDLENYGLTLDNGKIKIKHILEYRIYHINESRSCRFVYKIHEGNLIVAEGNFIIKLSTNNYFKISQFDIESFTGNNFDTFNLLGKIFIAKWSNQLDLISGDKNRLSNDVTGYSLGESPYSGSDQLPLFAIGIRSKNGFHLFNDKFDPSTLKFGSSSGYVRLKYISSNGTEEEFDVERVEVNIGSANTYVTFHFYNSGSQKLYVYNSTNGGDPWSLSNPSSEEIKIDTGSGFKTFNVNNFSISNDGVDVGGEHFTTQSYSLKIPDINIGNYLASLLSMLYPPQGITVKSEHPVVKNVFFQEDHVNKYIQEFVGISKINSDNIDTTTLLTLGKYSFAEYLTKLKTNFSVETFSNENMLNNVTPNFISLKKTTPLLFNIESVKPNVLYDQTLNSYYLFGSSNARIGGLISNLCKISQGSELINIPPSVEIPYISTFTNESGLLKGPSLGVYTCSYILKWIDLNSEYDLELNNYKGSQTYSIGVNDDNGSIYLNLVDLSKEDILLDISSKIMTPQ